MRRPSFCSARMMSSNRPRPVSRQVARRSPELDLHRLPDEPGRVDLPVRMRVGDADDLTLVLEAEHLLDPRPAAEIARLAPPHVDDVADRRRRHLRQRQIVARRKADDARVARPRARPGTAAAGRPARAAPPARRTGDRCRTRTSRHSAGCARRRRARCRGRGSSRDRTRGARRRRGPATVPPVHGRFCRCAATTTHSSRSGCQRCSQIDITHACRARASGTACSTMVSRSA